MPKMRPLIYLDAGTINRIADGECDSQSVSGLHAAMRSRNASLVLSLAHALDFCNGTSVETRQRVSTAINTFHSVVFACDSAERSEILALDSLEDGAALALDDCHPSHWTPKLLAVRD